MSSPVKASAALPVPPFPVRRSAPPFWLVVAITAGATVALTAAILQVNRYVAREHQVVTALTELSGEILRLRLLETAMLAHGRLTPEIEGGIAESHQRLQSALALATRHRRDAAAATSEAVHGYLDAIAAEQAHLAAGRADEARALGATQGEDTFAAVRDATHRARAEARARAAASARRSGIGIAAAMASAAVGLCGLFWGFARARGHAEAARSAHAALRQSETRLRALVQNATDVIAVLDRQGVIGYVSPPVERLLGYSPDQLHGLDAFSLVHAEDLAAARAAFQAVAEGRPQARLAFRVRRSDGSWCHVEAGGANLLTEPAVGGIVLNLRDVGERVAAQAAIAATAERFHALVRYSSDLTLMLDREGRIGYISPAVHGQLGHEPDALMYAPFATLVAPEDRGRVCTSLSELTTSARPRVHLEFRLQGADGRQHWVEGTFSNLLDNPHVNGVVVNLHDITSHRRTEEELRRTQRRYQRLFDDAPAMYVLTRATPDGPLILDCNAAFAQALGYDRAELRGRPLADFYTPASRTALLTGGYAQALAGGITDAERQLVARDGRVIDTLLRAVPEHDHAGRVTGTRAMFVDITARKRAEEAAALLASIVRSSDDAILAVSLDGMVQSWNGGAERIFAVDADEAVGRPIQALLPDGWEGWEAIAADVRRGVGRDHLAVHLRRADGSLAELSVTVSPIRNADGAVVSAAFVARDVTEQRRLAQRLAQAERLSALGELAAGVAHEVNNPLTAVVATAELLLHQELTPVVRDDLALIHREAQRAGDIVRSLLRFARHREPVREPLAPDTVLNDALAVLEHRLARHRIQVRRRCEPTPLIMADRDQLTQVLINLVNNAIDAMEAGGELTVAVTPCAEGVAFTVSDTGPGIAAEVLPRIFDPFFTTKPPGEGTGLGLSIAHGIVQAHGGHISASNRPEGGACFRVVLPAAPALAAEKTTGPPTAVAILHGDHFQAELLAQALSLLGYAAVDATDGRLNGSPSAEVAAIVVGPGAPPTALERLARGRHQATRVVAVGSVAAPPGLAWDATLPPSYRLDDLHRALTGGTV
jgi:PAS domain S-box-containing protein